MIQFYPYIGLQNENPFFSIITNNYEKFILVPRIIVISLYKDETRKLYRTCDWQETGQNPTMSYTISYHLNDIIPTLYDSVRLGIRYRVRYRTFIQYNL